MYLLHNILCVLYEQMDRRYLYIKMYNFHGFTMSSHSRFCHHTQYFHCNLKKFNSVCISEPHIQPLMERKKTGQLWDQAYSICSQQPIAGPNYTSNKGRHNVRQCLDLNKVGMFPLFKTTTYKETNQIKKKHTNP